MKKVINSQKKWLSKLLIFAMLVTSISPLLGEQTVMAASPLTITEAAGWLESAYVEWSPVSGAVGYAVYVKEASQADSAYVQLDSELIREYAGYWRADAVGLAAGNYNLKVAAIFSDGSVNAVQTSNLTVSAYDRSGFAFSSDSTYGSASGAYNDNGTLKSNAQVVYVTPETADTCTAVVNGKTVTGFQSILDAKQSAGTKDTSPIAFRIVGCVKADDVDHFSSSSEGIQIKGKSAYTEMNITIEGIGEDAAVHGFGFLVRNAGNVEFRNFAVMAFMDDGISLDTKNCNIWAHNMDLFYGSTGGDADQAKGDGSIDVKGASTNITISYVHFWDSGKCSLCGMSDSSEFLVTYHHNWFDHSDSRHPRIRVASVHVYNNYFDGNSKYGVGTTKGSSAFVEANYFRNCKYPMMSSLQGTDALGDGTFSGENGGMIKAYNNVVVGAESLIYANSDAGTTSADSKEFDAYLASSRSEQVPSSYTTVAGGTKYNNFDTTYDIGVDASDVDAPENVPAKVMQYAGRMNGGDFKWSFDNADDTDYDVDSALKNAIVNYTSPVVSIGGYTGNVDSDVEAPEVETPDVEESSSVEESSEVASSEVPSGDEPVYTFTSQTNYDFNLNDYISNLQVGDEVQITATMKGNTWYGGGVGANTYTNGSVSWTSANFSNDNDCNATATLNMAVPYAGNNTVSVQMWWFGSGEVDLYLDVVKVGGDEGTTEAPSVEESSSEEESSSDTPVTAVSYNHSFTTNGLNSDFFTINGNLSTSKGSVSYNGMTLTQCLKMESSTKISFNAANDAELTLVFNSANSSDVKVDGTKYSLDNGILTMELTEGSHTITKAASANLFYMSVETEGNGTVETPSEEESSKEESSSEETTIPPSTEGDSATGNVAVKAAGGWNETLYIELSGASDSNVKSVSYNGPVSGTLSGDDFTYLVRDYDGGVRVDIPGLKSGTYSVTVSTSKGDVTKAGITVAAQDRSGFAHFNYTSGVGAYNDNGTLKDNAIVLYVTDSNKNSVTVTSKDGTTVTGIGNILNSSGRDNGSGSTSKGGKANTNAEIIRKLAEDGTPLVVRIIGNVTVPSGVTEYDSVNYGGSVGDNGYMARIQDGLNITIEGIGEDAKVNGWGFHFMATSAHPDLGKSFEVRNISFVNVPEDCIGMEGVQTGTELTASVERCWIHHCSFYKPTISNPAESDKDGGDGACDFKRGQYFTNSYCYYEGYHKTNLIGASDSNVQYHLSYHHNYWKDCESRGPLARQANIHMYNNVFEGQTSYCMNPRANAYIFSEYNIFENSKNPMQIKKGAIKSFNDTFTNCKGDQDGTIVSSKTEKVSSDNKYASFELDSSLCYVASGNYLLHTDTSTLKNVIVAGAGTMK